MKEEILSKLELYFFPINITKLNPNSIIQFDLYIKTGQKFILYKNRHLKISQEDIERLIDNAVDTLFIHKKDKKNFRNYLEDNLETLLKSEEIPLQRKAEALHESAINVIQDVFDNPRSGASIKRSKEVISHTVDFILAAPQSFVNLLKIRKHDYYTYTHSVNVCTFLVSLSQANGIQDKKILEAVGEGGLLHDLGKSQIPSAIINKPGKLVKAEWEIMMQHPAFGVEIAKETRQINPISLTIIGQHHERPQGTGYPRGLKGSELDIYARMASIVDVYDAITTNRSYSTARSAMEAAHFLLEHKEDFNEPLLKTFIKMLAVKSDDKKM
jgi:HD-GYP domain-containing protein (c-di-GMP phosphodiesterase class II)